MPTRTSSMAAATSREKINEDTVRKAVKSLLKWKKKLHSQPNQNTIRQNEEEEDERDDFIYLSITLKKVPSKALTAAPHKIPLHHSLVSLDRSSLNLCLIIDGKRITSESASKLIKAHGIPSIKQVLKLSKLKSEFDSFDSKRELYESFDVFLAAKNVVPVLPKVLGKVFYRKKRKVPVPVDLRADGSNWKEEIERARSSSLWCLGGGTCSAVRVGRWGVTDCEGIVENVFVAVDGVLNVLPKRWRGIRCLHLKFSDSLALPIYQSDDGELGGERGGDFGLLGKKRKRSELLEDSGRKR